MSTPAWALRATSDEKKIFGVKVWRSWTVEGNEHPAVLEEAILLVRARSEGEAAETAVSRSNAEDTSFENEAHELVTVRTLGVDYVFATQESRATTGLELFARLYRVEEDDPTVFGPPPEIWTPAGPIGGT